MILHKYQAPYGAEYGSEILLKHRAPYRFSYGHGILQKNQPPSWFLVRPSDPPQVSSTLWCVLWARDPPQIPTTLWCLVLPWDPPQGPSTLWYLAWPAEPPKAPGTPWCLGRPWDPPRAPNTLWCLVWTWDPTQAPNTAIRFRYTVTLHRVKDFTLDHITLWLDVPGIEAAGFVTSSHTEYDSNRRYIEDLLHMHFVLAANVWIALFGLWSNAFSDVIEDPEEPTTLIALSMAQGSSTGTKHSMVLSTDQGSSTSTKHPMVLSMALGSGGPVFRAPVGYGCFRGPPGRVPRGGAGPCAQEVSWTPFSSPRAPGAEPEYSAQWFSLPQMWTQFLFVSFLSCLHFCTVWKCTKVTHNVHVAQRMRVHMKTLLHSSTPCHTSITGCCLTIQYSDIQFQQSLHAIFLHVICFVMGVPCRESQSGSSPCHLNGLKMAGSFSFIFCECFFHDFPSLSYRARATLLESFPATANNNLWLNLGGQSLDTWRTLCHSCQRYFIALGLWTLAAIVWEFRGQRSAKP